MASYKALNKFYSGMNQDIGYDKLQNTFYYFCTNGTLVTHEGLTSSNLTNVRGNKLFVTIPDTSDVWKLSCTLSSGTAYNFTLNITIGGILYSNNFVGTFSTNEALFQLIKVWVETSFPLSNNQLHAAYNKERIVIWSSLPITFVITITGVGPTVGSFPSIPALTGLKIIGWGLIRDDIYLITTNTLSPSGGFGQLWKLTYSKLTFVPTITLIYNENLRLTVQHPFPNPGGVIGIYENINIQRLYITDNFNRLRTFNVVDPNLMALDPTLIDVVPSVSFSPTILQKVDTNGQLELGVYQACYRLTNPTGAVTTITQPSNLVAIVEQDEGEATGGDKFMEYKGNVIGTQTNKRITWRIQQVDVSFEDIEIIILKRINKNAPPEIFVLPAQKVPSSGVYQFTYSGNEPVTTLTLQEFNTLSGTFTHVKSIAAKDSILFAAAVRKEKAILNYDARAYRFNNTGITHLIGNTPYVGGIAGLQGFDPLADAIPDPLFVATDRFNSQTGNLGGNGTNISYEFGTVAIRSDSVVPMTGVILSNTLGNSLQHTNPDSNIWKLDFEVPYSDDVSIQVYPTNNINSGTKFVYYSSCLKDYLREETYRMAFQGFDTDEDPYFTEWIGDIKMPGIYDLNTNAIYEDETPVPNMNGAVNDFRLSFTANRNGVEECFSNHLYIKFTIVIPQSLRAQLGGYSIVRVERTDTDKTILGQGLLTPSQYNGGAVAGADLFIPYEFPGPNNNYFNVLGDNSVSGGYVRVLNYTFDSPDFLLEGFPGSVSGDEIIVQAILDTPEYALLDTTVSVPNAERYHFGKWYNFLPLPVSTHNYQIYNAAFLKSGQSYFNQAINGGGYWFHNFAGNLNGVNYHQINSPDGGSSYGSPTLYLELVTPISYFTNYGCNSLTGHKLLAYYYRPNGNQYGGNTYSARTLNSYIPCGEFRPILKSTSANPGNINDTIRLFGGDCFTTLYDEQKLIKFWSYAQGGAIGVSPQVGPTNVDNNGVEKLSYSVWFPVQSTCNPDLRYGQHPNVNVFANTGTAGDTAISETLDYNPVFSVEDDTKVYFPRPLNFVSIEENDNRIHASQVKISGENNDSWSVFKPNDYIDVDGIYGPINQLINWNNKLIFFQDRAFGTTAVNERSMIIDTSGSSIAVGGSGILTRRDYISNTIGTKHQFSFSIGPEGVHWLDILNKKFFILSNNGLKGLEGLDGYLNTHLISNILIFDNPYTFKGATSTYDYTFGQFVSSVNNSSGNDSEALEGFCISYLPKINNNQGGFHSFYSYTTPVYINDKSNLFNVSEDLNSIWMMHEGDYGSWYGTVGDFRVDFIMNEAPGMEKVLDNLILNTTSFIAGGVNADNLPFIIDQKGQTFDEYRIFNSYQNQNWVPINIQTARRVKRLWQLKSRGNQVQYTGGTNFDIFDNSNLFTYPARHPITQRLKSNYFFINLRYDNISNTKLTLESCDSIFRVNPSTKQYMNK